jgi:hypothetical protein
MQGADFWTHCGCGDSREAQRRTQAGALVDSVDTAADLNAQIIIRAIAYDDAGNVLWLHGSGRNDNVGRFLKVSSNAEPDVLLQQADFPAFLESMTWDGTNVWAIAGFTNDEVIAQIDVTTFKAVDTFENPDPSIQWYGIAAVNGNLFLIGENDANEGVLAEVAPIR